MDALTLARAKKVAQALVDAVAGDVGDLDKVVDQLSEDLAALVTDAGIIDQDGDIASELIINRLRQHIWQNEEEALICEVGSVTLTNTAKFPFNNSQATVALAKVQKDTNYTVIPEDSLLGNVGDIVVSNKQVNGFKIEFTGSAASATVKYIVIGGYDA